jgi:hypothetical protein
VDLVQAKAAAQQRLRLARLPAQVGRGRSPPGQRGPEPGEQDEQDRQRPDPGVEGRGADGALVPERLRDERPEGEPEDKPEDESFGNEPDQNYNDVGAVTTDAGGGLNGSKQQIKRGSTPGNNPLPESVKQRLEAKYQQYR